MFKIAPYLNRGSHRGHRGRGMKRFFVTDPISWKRQCPNHDSLFCILRVLRVLRDSDSFRDSDDKRIHLTQANIKQDVYDSQITEVINSGFTQI
ncbi:hypothetical protein C6499_11205 [Candidatus Poribacteria bacterium]|nr:MAG: hypothetical protein C6499_11205 [Candidatus Poribacteria bacterium]